MTEKCDHTWSVVHTIYGGPRGGTLIRRWCYKCGLQQVGTVRRWRTEREDEFDRTCEEACDD